VIALAGVSASIFWIGMLLRLAFAVKLNWLPATGSGSLSSLILSAITIGGNSTGNIMRMTRSSMLEVLSWDDVRTARAKGLGGRSVIYPHALRNALIPLVTVAGMQSPI
jgi:peptide/nickel transport system permease protein